MQEDNFGKNDAKKLKAVALLLMLLHHCFLKGRFEQFYISFWPLSANVVVNIAFYSRICVSMFAFVSGYGLYLAYGSRNCSADKWVWQRLKKTLSDFWFVYVLSFAVCMLIDRRPISVYGFESSLMLGGFNMLIDFLGLSHLFGVESLCATWWYMSAAVTFILLCPIIHMLIEKCGCLCTMAVLVCISLCAGAALNVKAILDFLVAFSVGMMFAKTGLFGLYEHFYFFGKDGYETLSELLKLLILLVAMFISYKLYHALIEKGIWDYLVYGLLPVPVIVFAKSYIIGLPLLDRFLELLGKHTTNIFLTHTFIRYYYLEELTYSWRHFIAVLVFLLLSSLLLSIFIEKLKKASRKIVAVKL